MMRDVLAAAACSLCMAAAVAASGAPLLEQALAHEWRGEFEQARALYVEAQAAGPEWQRPALLGLARVARGQYRVADARAIYRQLLEANPTDVEAINGMAWADLADSDVAAARAGFRHAQALQPGNAEAAEGLSHADRSWRYQLDVKGSVLHNSLGTREGGSVTLQAALDARQSIEVALRRNGADDSAFDRLASTAATSTAARLGYRWQIPGDRGLTLAYEHVDRQGLPDQQRVSAAADFTLTPGVRAVGGIRQSFGSGWDSRLYHLGVVVALRGGWEAVVTGFSERNADFGTHRSVVAVEAVRQGPGRMLLAFGASHGRNPDTTEVYGRAVLPVTPQDALLVTARRMSLNRESQLELGWRHYWN